MAEDKKEKVVDFSKLRTKRLDQKRRKNERIFFKQLLGIYTVVGHEEMREIEIVDVSEDGCSFQVPHNVDDPWPGKQTDLPVRFYFSQDTYLPVRMEIINSRPCIEEGVRMIQYGCKIDKDLKSYEAYRSFVKFLKEYAEEAHKDTGKTTFYYL